LTARPGLRRAIFLDRDGVLNAPVIRNGRSYPPDRWENLEILPSVAEACRILKDNGLLLIAATNQPDIARGRTAEAEVHRINDNLQARLGLDDVLVCPHDDADGCLCRKPRPGLLVAAARRHGIDLPSSVMVGDRWRDIGAGKAARCRTVFVDWGYDEERPKEPDLTVGSLAEAVPWILASLEGKSSP
jgi:D-glycero-D-manno-heptose 1,7-bisphosphate phosphatase